MDNSLMLIVFSPDIVQGELPDTEERKIGPLNSTAYRLMPRAGNSLLKLTRDDRELQSSKAKEHCSPSLWSPNAELPQACSECAGIHSKDSCRTHRPLYPPCRLLQNSHDVSLFHIPEITALSHLSLHVQRDTKTLYQFQGSGVTY